jgi:hypothetical protein
VNLSRPVKCFRTLLVSGFSNTRHELIEARMSADYPILLPNSATIKFAQQSPAFEVGEQY